MPEGSLQAWSVSYMGAGTSISTSDDSVVLSKVFPWEEVDMGWGKLNLGSFTCSREICAASSKIDSVPFREVLAQHN